MKSIFIFLLFILAGFTLNAQNVSYKKKFDIQIKSVETLFESNQSKTEVVILEDKNTKLDIKLYRRRSLNNPNPQPTLFVLSGLKEGLNTIKLIPEVPGTTVISLDYEPTEETPDTIQNIGNTITDLLKIQAKIVSTYLWLIDSPQVVDINKISVIMISFGTYITPSALSIIQTVIQAPPKSTVFLFGGASAKSFFDVYIGEYGVIKLDAYSRKQISGLLEPINTFQFLKNLQGPFLVINGTEDTVIPEKSAQDLFDNLNEPKTQVWLETDHINSESNDVIKQTLDNLIPWMREQGAF